MSQRLSTQASGFALALLMTVVTLSSLQALALHEAADAAPTQMVIVVGHRAQNS